MDKVFVTPDMSPYKKRKVRILNGAHTGFVLGAYLAGEDIVRDCMNDEVIKGFMNKMLYDEVIPTLPLDKDDLLKFAAAVSDRFNNPFVNHELMSISLNSTSKWKARNMPSFLEYIKEEGRLPECLTMSLAAYIAFYSNDIQALTDAGLVCKRPAGNEYTVSDDRWVLEFYYDHKDDSEEELVHAVLTNEKNVGSGFDTDRRSGGQGYRKLKEDSYRRRKGCIRKLPVIAGKCVKTAESSAAESLKWASAAFFS